MMKQVFLYGYLQNIALAVQQSYTLVCSTIISRQVSKLGFKWAKGKK